ncbi:MAG: undecaprenyl-diphosphate phosphatase, partial [Candidatus Geothermincolales bacterium]
VADALGPSSVSLEEVDWRRALAMGLAQALALAPGVSRSGAILCTGRAAGLKREGAADFAFLMSVPVIAAAGAFEAMKMFSEGIGGRDLLAMAVGAASSAVAGLLAIRYLLRWLGKRSLAPFAVYRVALSLAMLVLLFVG